MGGLSRFKLYTLIVMQPDAVFNPAFLDNLLAEIRICMAIAVEQQSRIHNDDGFIQRKEDHSPVTDADLAVQERLEHFLREQMPDWEFVGEESAARWQERGSLPEFYWMCDPIDGTAEYARGGDEFAINVALIQGNTPIFGLIAAPAFGNIAYTHAPDAVTMATLERSFAIEPPSRLPAESHKLITGHRCHGDVKAYELATSLSPAHHLECASALKFHALLTGEADAYTRQRPTSEWDIAAGHALVCALGGQAMNLDRKPLTYGHIDRQFKLNSVFILR